MHFYGCLLCIEDISLVASTKLGLCLGWKGQCICCVTRGREGGRGGRERGREGGREVRGGDGGRRGREVGEGRREGGEGG